MNEGENVDTLVGLGEKSCRREEGINEPARRVKTQPNAKLAFWL